MKTVDKARFPLRDRQGIHFTELQVLHSGAGYYIGRMCFDEELGFEEPYSRESYYFATEQQAAHAMREGFELRQCIENDAAYASGDLPKPPLKEKQ